MARSLSKPPYVSPSLMRQLLKGKRVVQTWSRQSSILPDWVGLLLQVHQGKSFVQIQVTEEMVGSKLGEYAPTRKFNVYKKKQKKK